MQDLDVFELGGVVEAEAGLAVGVDQQSCIEFPFGLFHLVEALDDDGG